jgi:hypothetical protein
VGVHQHKALLRFSHPPPFPGIVGYLTVREIHCVQMFHGNKYRKDIFQVALRIVQ